MHLALQNRSFPTAMRLRIKLRQLGTVAADEDLVRPSFLLFAFLFSSVVIP